MTTPHEKTQTFGLRFAYALIGAAMLFTYATCAKSAEAADCEYRIYAPLGGGHANMGSGTAIAPRVIVTAAHVTERKHLKNITVTAPDGTKYNAECSALGGNKADLALLEVLDGDLPVWSDLAPGDPASGQQVIAVGYGHNSILRQGSGQAGSKNSEGKVEGTIKIESGDSGGGLFNEQGQLCGVLVEASGRQPPGATVIHGDFVAEPVSRVAWLCDYYQTQCPNGQCPLMPQTNGGGSGQMIPVQPRPSPAPQYAQPQYAPQPYAPGPYYVYPAPAPQPAPAPAPAPVAPAQPIDTAPLEGKVDRLGKSLGGKLDDLTAKADAIIAGNAAIVPKVDAATAQIKGVVDGQGTVGEGVKSFIKNEIDTKVMPHLGKFGTDLQAVVQKGEAFNATPGGAIAQEVAKGLLAAGVTAASGGTLPTWLQWLAGIGGTGAIGVIGAFLLKIMGIIGTTPPTGNGDLAAKIIAEVRTELDAAKQNPQFANVATKVEDGLDKALAFITKIVPLLQPPQPPANPTTTA